MKRTALTITCFIITLCTIAQRKIIVQGTYPDLYISHTVAAKETLTNIGKLYNIAPAPVAKLNGFDNGGTLTIGKEIKIPVNKTNFTQDGQCGEGEVLIPLYHIVQKGENLFRISQVFGKVRIDFVREWNDLNNDVIQPNQKIIIGHLKVAKEKAGDIMDGIAQTGTTTDNGYDVSNDNTSRKEPETKPAPTSPTVTAASNDDSEGFFVTQYPSDIKDRQVVSKAGDAATFKTTSGWSDKKYYVLMNDVTPGTIIRITATNNRSICAKVLGALPDMKENVTVLLRMSSAAASALHITDAKFQVQVNFYK